MSQILYVVTATLPSKPIADEYAAWLAGGHVAKVVAHGALSGFVARLDVGASGEYLVESHYIFASREAFTKYETQHAPALRKEGLAKFGPERGVKFARKLGEVVYRNGQKT